MKAKILRALASDGKPKGYALIRDFLNELDDQRIPRTATTRTLANAFKQILMNDADPMVALQLKRHRGEKLPRTGKQDAERYGKIWQFIASRLDEVDPAKSRAVPHGLLEQAISTACEHFEKDRRTVQRAWARYAPSYKFYRDNSWALAQVKAHLTAAEFASIGEGPIDIALLIAAARKRGQPLGSTFIEEVKAAVARRERAQR